MSRQLTAAEARRAVQMIEDLTAEYSANIGTAWMAREPYFLMRLRAIAAAGRPTCEHGWRRPHGLWFGRGSCPGPTGGNK